MRQSDALNTTPLRFKSLLDVDKLNWHSLSSPLKNKTHGNRCLEVFYPKKCSMTVIKHIRKTKAAYRPKTVTRVINEILISLAFLFTKTVSVVIFYIVVQNFRNKVHKTCKINSSKEKHIKASYPQRSHCIFTRQTKSPHETRQKSTTLRHDCIFYL